MGSVWCISMVPNLSPRNTESFSSSTTARRKLYRLPTQWLPLLPQQQVPYYFIYNLSLISLRLSVRFLIGSLVAPSLAISPVMLHTLFTSSILQCLRVLRKRRFPPIIICLLSYLILLGFILSLFYCYHDWLLSNLVMVRFVLQTLKMFMRLLMRSTGMHSQKTLTKTHRLKILRVSFFVHFYITLWLIILLAYWILFIASPYFYIFTLS